MQNRPANILVVDDNPENLSVLSRILEDEGFHTRTAKNGQLALNSIKAAIPDIALVDIHMPVMDGYDLCKQIKNDPRYDHIPVIFISAMDESFNKLMAFDVGGVDYITKPVDPREVIARVGAHLKIIELQSELREHNRDLDAQVKERTTELDLALEQLRDLNQKLNTLDAAKNDFLKLISHELRTPLVGLGIVDQLFTQKDLSDQDADQYKDIFWASHQKLINIVDHATVLTKLNLQQLDYESTPHTIYDLMKKSYEKLSHLLQTSNVSIALDGPKEVTIFCDENYSKMTFNALIETAIKFTNSGETIHIDWKSDDDSSTIVIDTVGWLVPEKYQEQFFDVFSIHESIFPGGDLGLAPAVAKQVVNLCGGKITISNREDGISIQLNFPQKRQ